MDQIAFSQEEKGSASSARVNLERPPQQTAQGNEGEAELDISPAEKDPVPSIPDVSPRDINKFNKFKEMTKSEPVTSQKTAAPAQEVSPFSESPGFEQQIRSVELEKAMMIKVPENHDEEKGNLPLEVAFCKKYAGIKISKNASFTERMEFDIYKRATKDSRLDLLINAQKPKLDKMEQQELFKRLAEDGKRRNQRILQLEKFKAEGFDMSATTQRKMNEKDFAKIYEKMMDKLQRKENDLKKQRVFQQMIKEFNEQKVLEKSVSHNKRMGQRELSNMLERFEKDNERRKMAAKIKQEQMELLRKEEERKFFKPDLSKKSKKDAEVEAEADEGESTPVSMTTISDDIGVVTDKMKRPEDTKSLARLWERAQKTAREKKAFQSKPPMVPKKTKGVPAGSSNTKVAYKI